MCIDSMYRIIDACKFKATSMNCTAWLWLDTHFYLLLNNVCNVLCLLYRVYWYQHRLRNLNILDNPKTSWNSVIFLRNKININTIFRLNYLITYKFTIIKFWNILEVWILNFFKYGSFGRNLNFSLFVVVFRIFCFYV